MKKNRMATALVALVLSVALLLGGCGGSPASQPAAESPSSQAADNSSQASAPAADARVLKLAATLAPDTSPILCLEDMSETMKELTNGAVDIQVFPSSQLGGQRDFVEGVSMGTVEMCIVAVSALESFEPRFAVYGLPFLFEDDDHVYSFYDSAINQEILDEFCQQKGMRALGIFNEGFRTVWTKKPVSTLEDFQGMKMRVPEIPLYMDMFTALGTNATPMPAGDIYTAMQTGVIDGIELPVSSVLANKFSEVVSYNTITNHCSSPLILLVSESVYQSLSDEEKDALLATAQAAAAADRSNLAADAAKYQQELEASGIEQITLSADEMAKIREAMEPVVEKYSADVFSAEVLEEIRAMAN